MKIIYRGVCKICETNTVVSISLSWNISNAARDVIGLTVEKNDTIEATCPVCKKPMILNFAKFAKETDSPIQSTVSDPRVRRNEEE